MDEVMVTHTASLQGLAAPTWFQPRTVSQRLGNTISQTHSPPKQTRRSRCIKTAALTASQDTVSVLPFVNEFSMDIASPCTPLSQHAAAAATPKLESTFAQPPPATEQQPDVLEVLTQQLAEQHIPFCFPSQLLTPAPLSELSTGHLTQAASSYLLHRYLLGVPACTTPPAVLSQEQQHQALPQGMHHLPNIPDRHSAVSQPSTPRHQEHLESRHLQHAKSCMPACAWVASECNQHQTHCEAQWTAAELCQLPQFACMQEMASRTLLESHRCLDSTCQSAEVLRLRTSKGQTWKGLALRQGFMSQAVGQSDDEASVQDAAGGGGLLHGGAEDGGEGGGPSRGWGGAAGEDGDAEEDEDEDDDDEDEDQDDDDEDKSDSSSEDSHSESDWASSAQIGPHSMQCVRDFLHAQGVVSSPHNNQNVCSCSQWLHQSSQSKQQPPAYQLDQQHYDVFQISPAFSCDFDSRTNCGRAAANKADAKACQQQVLASIVRYRTTCRRDVYSLMPSDREQQGHVLRYKDLHVKQKQSAGSVWKDIPNFAVRLCINVLGSCF